MGNLDTRGWVDTLGRIPPIYAITQRYAIACRSIQYALHSRQLLVYSTSITDVRTMLLYTVQYSVLIVNGNRDVVKVGSWLMRDASWSRYGRDPDGRSSLIRETS